MRRFRAISILASLVALTGAAHAAESVARLGPCKQTVPATIPSTPSSANALSLLGSVTQLGGRAGRPVLESNLANTIAINVEASPEARAQALIDTFITDTNANILADGLGATMGEIYRRKAIVESKDDGATSSCGEISPNVSALIAAMNRTSGSDSQSAKFGFADGAGGRYQPPQGGTFDVFGKAYGVPAGALGSDPRGNSRPFQVAPVGARSGPRTRTYDGKDFFGIATNSRLMLTGPSPAETAAGLTGSDLTQNPSFPSGHTTFGYTESLLLALMVPERLRALAYRGSEYGDSRIVVGAHYALDVIAGRTLATYDLAQALAGRPGYADTSGRPFQETLAAATANLRAHLQANGCPSIAACAARDPIVRAENAAILMDAHPQSASPREAFAFRLSYGLEPIASTTQPPEPVPPEAAFLLQSRFPYLTQAQRQEVLRTTEGPSGYFLDVSPLDRKPLRVAARVAGRDAEAQAGVYSRLNLFDAAGGYAVFRDQVEVEQDVAAIKEANLRAFADFARADTWSNDISGLGGLTKRGSGMLTLSGANTYRGPTIVEGGTLAITGTMRSPVEVKTGGTLTGSGAVDDVRVGAGGVLVGSEEEARALQVRGALKLDKGSVVRVGAAETPMIHVKRAALIDGADLIVVPRAPLRPGTQIAIVSAEGGIQGAFRRVAIKGSSLVPKLAYTPDAVYLNLEEKSAARTVPR